MKVYYVNMIMKDERDVYPKPEVLVIVDYLCDHDAYCFSNHDPYCFRDVKTIKICKQSRNKHLRFLKYYPNLERLFIKAKINDPDSLKYCPKLLSLTIPSGFTSMCEAATMYCKNLLGLSMKHINDFDLKKLASLRHLRYLDISTAPGYHDSDTWMSMKDLVEACPLLKRLNIAGKNMDDIEYIDKLLDLEELTCDYIKAQDVTGLTDLEKIVSTEMIIKSELWLPSLRELSLNTAYIDSFVHLRECTKLRSLHIDNHDDITDDEQILSELILLEELTLNTHDIGTEPLDNIVTLTLAPQQPIVKLPYMHKLARLTIDGPLACPDNAFSFHGNIKYVSLSNAGNVNLAWFEHSELEELRLTNIENVVGHSYPSLKIVKLKSCGTDSLDFLVGTQIQTLSIRECKIKDYSALMNIDYSQMKKATLNGDIDKSILDHARSKIHVWTL